MSDPSDVHTRALESLKLRVYRDGQRLRDAVENCRDALPDTLRHALLARATSVSRSNAASRQPFNAMRG
jgi:hypothetical protein